MKEIISLKTNYRENYLKRIAKTDGSESKTYVLKTDSDVVRTGVTPEGNNFLAPSGGPMIVVNEELEEANAVVSSIDFTENYGWTITFK